MPGVVTPELAAAISEAGGLAMISGVRLPPQILGRIIDSIRQLTDKPIGVNFLVPFLDPQSVAVAAATVRVVEFFYGEPDAALIETVHKYGALASWQVGSSEEAAAAVRAGCDFVIAQGTEAGGHIRGRIGLLPLLSSVLDAVPIPVLAAGGIGTARDLAAVLAAGADGARVGTRFVASLESGAHPHYVDALIQARAEDTVITEAFSATWPNAPHRVLRSCVEAANSFPDPVVAEMDIAGSTMAVPRFGSPAPTKQTTGAVRAMALYAGESVAAVRARQPAREIVEEVIEGAEQLLFGTGYGTAITASCIDP
jgi:nitronate monooxygenase